MKDIICEQGVWFLLKLFEQICYYVCKMGGLIGLLCMIYYDQEVVDYLFVVMFYVCEWIGKLCYCSELYFVCCFLEQLVLEWLLCEDFKCFVMNWSNIFFD